MTLGGLHGHGVVQTSGVGTTIGVDFIRSSTQIAQLMLYSISQGIVAWRLGQPESWGITKVAEFLVVYGCALAGFDNFSQNWQY